MAERPLLATDRVALAIREGRQNQDRRPIRPRHHWHVDDSNTGEPWPYYDPYVYAEPEPIPVPAPWKPGDRLYVREAHAWADKWVDGFDREEPNTVAYRADGEIRHVHISGSYSLAQTVDDFRGIRFRPNIHMPKWAARTWVRVSRVWVERVRDISAKDMRAEGITCRLDNSMMTHCNAMPCASLRKRFVEMWESLYPGSWKRNDWVWCCEFEREEQGR